jgi:hypothetical protein
MVTLMILKQGRLGSAGQFPNQLMHLERALTLLDSNPRESLQVFESLDQSFWQRWTRVAVRDRSGDGSFLNYSGIMLRLTEQLDTIRTAWPDAARQVCATDAELCLRMLRRFGQVAEWIDAEAAEWLADDDDQRGEWVEYQPLTLTRAAEALSPIDREAADHAVQRGLAVILTAPAPAREFALAANAARWKRVDSASSGKAVTEALSRIQRLRERGVGRGWWPWIPQLLEWTARVDVDTALVLARDTDMSIRAAALASVASVLSSR